MIKHTKALGGATALFSAAFIFATFGPLIREMSAMFGDITQVAARFALTTLFVAAIVLVRRISLRLPLKQTLLTISLGALSVATIVPFTMAVNTIPLATSVGMLYVGSIVAALVIGRLVLKEAFTLPKFIAICVALAGLGLYAQTPSMLWLSALGAVVAGVFEGTSHVVRKLLGTIDRTAVLAYQFIVGTIILWVAVAVSGEQAIRTVSLGPIVATIIFAALQVGLGNLLLYGFKRFDVNLGAIILATELGFAALFGWLLYGEVPAGNELAGAVLVFAAAAVASAKWGRSLVNNNQTRL